MAHSQSVGDKPARPLSPHLQIYKPLINSVMSILHRLTGIILYVGTLLVAWWLTAAATGPEYFSWVSMFFSSTMGRLVLFAYSWVLIHHMLGGIRHFIWDTGAGFELPMVNRLCWATIIGSVLLTMLLWFFALGGMGAWS